MGVLSSLKNKISNPRSPGEDINKTWTHRVVEAGLHNGIKATGSLIKGAGSNLVSGHWNESGLANIFGALPGWEKTKSGKIVRSPKSGKGGSGLDPKSANNLETLATNSGKANEHLAGIHSAMVKMDDNMKKGFVGLYQLISGMSRKATDPFDAVTKRRALSPKTKPALLAGPNAQKSGLGGLFGMIGSLFSKNGLIGAGLSGIMKIATSLMGVVGLLNKGVARLATAALGLVAPMLRGIVKLAGGALLALGATAKRVFNRFKGRPRVIAPKPSVPLLEPPKPALPSPKPTIEPEGAKPRPSSVDEAGRPVPKEEPHANRPNPTEEPHGRPTAEPEGAKPRATAEEPHGRPATPKQLPHATEADLLPRSGEPAKPVTEPLKQIEGPKPNALEPAKPVELPKPTTGEAPTTPKSTPSSSKALTVTEDVVKDALHDAPKPKPRMTLKGVLGKTFGAAVAGLIEGAVGFVEWSDAYDQYMDGKISENDYKKVSSEVIGKVLAGTGGAILGGKIGAVVGGFGGSIVPGLGTAAGAVGGGLIGAAAGAFGANYLGIGEAAGDAVFKTMVKNRDNPEADIPQGKPARNLQAQPSRQAPAQNMIQGSQQQARSNAGTTVIAPTTNNVTNNNNSGGRSGGATPQAPGPSRPGYDGLDNKILGLDIPF